MSFTTVRAEFVTALTGLPGIYPSSDVPGDMGTGSAWPMWTGLEATGSNGYFEAAWVVRVVTGGTPADATAFMDTHLAALVTAIQPVAYVQTITPVQLAATNAGDLYAIDIRTVRE